jgi:hypothetical protein
VNDLPDNLPRWRRRLLDVLLLPLALLVIVAEDVLWRGAKLLLRRIAALAAVGWLRGWLGRLTGWAALPLFLVPELAARLGELWVAVLLIERRVAGAVLVYCLVRLVATLIAVFIWQACAPALLRLRWFARMVAWITFARDWALCRIAPWRARAKRLGLRTEGGVVRRVQMLRQLVLHRGWTR